MAAKKATVGADEPPVELQAIEPIRHDGAAIAPGERFAVPVAQADSLILAGAACLPLPPVLPE